MAVTQLQYVTDDAGAITLAERLNGTRRRRPVVVVTVPAGRDEPFIDAEEVVAQVGDLADVYLMPTGSPTWAFSDRMPDQTQVYGGAGRAYPVGHEWVSNPYASPLRFAFNEEEGERSTRALASDALRMAAAAGLIRTTPSRHRRRVEGTVEGIPVDERALVKFDGTVATIVQELTVPDVPLGRVLTVGMTVTGWFDNETRRLDIRDSLNSPDQALAEYDVGAVVLAHVREVHEDRAVLQLHPDVPVMVARDQVTANDLDDLRSLMTTGEVLPCRVTARGPDWRLTLLDVDDDEHPLPAASLLDGGPPWLEPPRWEDFVPDWPQEPARSTLPVAITSPPAAETVSAARAPAVNAGATAAPATALSRALRPTPLLLDRRRRAGTSDGAPVAAPEPSAAPATAPAKGSTTSTVTSMALTIDELRAEVATLRERLRSVEAELEAGKAERAALVAQRHDQQRTVHLLGQELRSQRAKLRKAKRPSRADERMPTFADREDGFRHAVKTAWALRTPVAEQPVRPLGDFSLGEGFLDSLDRTPGLSVAKVADVVFEIVTGRVHEVAGRDVHQQRVSAGPGSAYRRRDDGATLWRAALQINSPQARRIHYWALADGSYELVDVRLHDDW